MILISHIHFKDEYSSKYCNTSSNAQDSHSTHFDRPINFIACALIYILNLDKTSLVHLKPLYTASVYWFYDELYDLDFKSYTDM